MGRLGKWLGLIAPFYDRPDITRQVVWYPAAQPYTPGPATIFPDRFYDAIENWQPGGPGTVPGSLKEYFGPVPPSVLTPQIGSDADFAQGISYAAYTAKGGSPGSPCVTVDSPCGQCKAGPPQVWYVDSSGWTGPDAGQLNARFALTYQGLCTWKSPVFPIGAFQGQWVLMLPQLIAPTLFLISVFPPGFGPGGASYIPFPSYNCRTAFSVPMQWQQLGADAGPPSVQLTPSPQGGPDLTPPGMVAAFAGPSAPSGWLACDGSAYPVGGVYANLSLAIGSAWNTFRGQAAPPAGQFRVPLMNGLAVGGVGGAVAAVPPFPATQNRNLGDVVGEETHTLGTGEMPTHTHPINDPGHTHTPSTGAAFRVTTAGSPTADLAAGATGFADGTTHSSTTGVSMLTAGGGGAHNNVQPTGFLLYCIKM